jgi:hypothetical protein
MEQSVREHYRAQILEELNAVRLPALDATVEALSTAAAHIATETARLRRDGIGLSKGMLTSMSTDLESCKTELDRLKVLSNRVRHAFQGFEGALKDFKLMKKLTRTNAPARASRHRTSLQQ